MILNRLTQELPRFSCANHKLNIPKNFCPISLEVIQILNPAYFTTLGWEKNNMSIADVIPQVQMVIDYWTKIEMASSSKIIARV